MMFSLGACATVAVGKRDRALGGRTALGCSFSVASMLSILALKESIVSPGSVTACLFCIVAYATFISRRKVASSGASVLTSLP